MEAAVLNFLDTSDKVLIVNGGTFGQRWCDLCRVHSISFVELKLNAGDDIDLDRLSQMLCRETFTALLINAHETSTGQLYDIEAIGQIEIHRFRCNFRHPGAGPFAHRDKRQAWWEGERLLGAQNCYVHMPGVH